MKNLALIRIAVCTTILLIVFISKGVFAETFFSGTIDQNTTWDIAGSPYILTGNVTVGKEIYFEMNRNGRWDSSPEKFSDFGYDKIPGNGDSGEGNSRYDHGEPFEDEYPNEIWDSHEPLEDINRNNRYDEPFTLTINPGVEIRPIHGNWSIIVNGILKASGVSFKKSSSYQVHLKTQNNGRSDFINCKFDSNIIQWLPGSRGSIKACSGTPETIIESPDVIVFKNEF
ncbi:MAG: hypothetical protein PF503_12165 [Desulfobacula sp.]|jgi:hypothetical protein|nr:hypothetical protein [Desulfobacula sp.]